MMKSKVSHHHAMSSWRAAALTRIALLCFHVSRPGQTRLSAAAVIRPNMTSTAHQWLPWTADGLAE